MKAADANRDGEVVMSTPFELLRIPDAPAGADADMRAESPIGGPQGQRAQFVFPHLDGKPGARP